MAVVYKQRLRWKGGLVRFRKPNEAEVVLVMGRAGDAATDDTCNLRAAGVTAAGAGQALYCFPLEEARASLEVAASASSWRQRMAVVTLA